jgi:hypothetical protein
MSVKMPDGKTRRVEFTPALARDHQLPVIDTRRAPMNRPEADWGGVKMLSVWPGAENSPALKSVADDPMGPYLIVKVNGQKIFCNGGNWGMDDALKRIPRERLEPFIRLHRDAHLDMIRNWAGQSTSETFYDLCDEYGLLVWNDFWMSTEGWNYAPANPRLFLDNVADTIKRFRNHPCIALWCARNEGVPPEGINQGNDQLIRQFDGTRFYQPDSRSLGLRTSGPWDSQPLEKYFQELNHGFSTEMGAASIPSAETLRAMMPTEDLWPPADVWAYHDFHSRGAIRSAAFLKELNRRYGQTKNLDDFCAKAQMLNYDTYRAIYEGFDSHIWNDCSGVLLWMSHPSWPSVVWQIYSSDYEPNASYFGAKKASEPIHIQMNLPDCGVSVINHRFTPLTDVTALATLYDLAGRPAQTLHRQLTAPANACTNVFALDWPATGAYFVKLTLQDRHGQALSENFYWHSRDPGQLQDLNSLPQVELSGKLRVSTLAHTTEVQCNLSNASQAPALAIKLTLRDAATGRRLLPVYYDDNYFSLLPGESRKIHIETGCTAKPTVEVSGWNIAASTIGPASF